MNTFDIHQSDDDAALQSFLERLLQQKQSAVMARAERAGVRAQSSSATLSRADNPALVDMQRIYS